MTEMRHDSSGVKGYISSPENILETLTEITGIDARTLKNGEKKEPSRAREIAAILLCEGLGMSYMEVGNIFSRMSGTAVRQKIKRGVRRLKSDEDFAHTFAYVERASNLTENPL